MDLLDKDIISFRAGDAIDFGGICEATLLRNLTHWTQKRASDRGEVTPHEFRPKALSRSLPFSLSTIKRALARLEGKGAIKKTRSDGQRASSYALGEALEQRIKIPSVVTRTNRPKVGAPSPASDFQAESNQTAPRPSIPSDDVNVRALITANAEFFSHYPNDHAEVAGNKILSICARIVANIPDPELFNRFSSRSLDELLVAAIRLCEDAKVDALLVNLCSEMLVHALRPPGWHCNASEPLFYRAAYRLRCEVGSRGREHLKNMKLQAYQRDRECFASPDSQRECEHELAPAAKVRILRNGIIARNKFGFLDSNNDRIRDRIAVTKEGLTIAEEFFVLNTQWSAGDVLGLLEHCAQLDDNPPDGGHDKLWHARRGRNLGFLMKNLDTVVNRLGLSASLPCFVMPAPVESDPPTAAPLPAEP
jgi:hypothetical protein